jgi:RecA/RadA recombinase
MANKQFDLEAYKKSIKIADTPLKKDKFVVLEECIQAVIGMPGIPLGHIVQAYGKSDTGKTSLAFETAAKCQKQNILPVLIITEGKVDWDRAAQMGFDRNGPCIIEENIEYLEDVFKFIDRILADVEMGVLPLDTQIIWDSVGNTLSQDEVTVNKDGTTTRESTMMKAAKVITEAMRILSHKVNNTRKVSYPRSVGLLIINQAYMKPPAFKGGPSVLTPYGGDAIWFRSSLVLKFSKNGKLSATRDGNKFGFGINSRITVDKNHITPVTNSGDFIITADAIFPNEKGAIDDYKAAHKDVWGSAEIMDEATGEVKDE